MVFDICTVTKYSVPYNIACMTVVMHPMQWEFPDLISYLLWKMADGRRALHFVFKVADRDSTVKFYKEILGMKILRHEEFEEGCKASCNG